MIYWSPRTGGFYHDEVHGPKFSNIWVEVEPGVPATEDEPEVPPVFELRPILVTPSTIPDDAVQITEAQWMARLRAEIDDEAWETLVSEIQSKEEKADADH